MQCYAETITGILLHAKRKCGKVIKVICPEIRPYYQGTRLTASLINNMGFPVTVICDNMLAYLMKERNVGVFTSATGVICLDGLNINKV